MTYARVLRPRSRKLLRDGDGDLDVHRHVVVVGDHLLVVHLVSRVERGGGEERVHPVSVARSGPLHEGLVQTLGHLLALHDLSLPALVGVGVDLRVREGLLIHSAVGRRIDVLRDDDGEKGHHPDGAEDGEKSESDRLVHRFFPFGFHRSKSRVLGSIYIILYKYALVNMLKLGKD